MNPRKGLTALSAALLLAVGACAGSDGEAKQSTPPSPSSTESTEAEESEESQSPAGDKEATESEPSATETSSNTGNLWPTCDEIAAAISEFITSDFAPDDRDMPAEPRDGELACAWSVFTGQPGDAPNRANIAMRWVYLMGVDGLPNPNLYEVQGMITSPSAAEELGGYAISENKAGLTDPIGRHGSSVAFDGYLISVRADGDYPAHSPIPVTHAQGIDYGIKVYQDLLQ
ncbi:hypothetical protein V5R04_14410 [Jonesiaceae bacterium BS-20]|uniref:Uncharacterized protein n=1 Tax=Jonesiaceae bacterium BS-20 TaxID=3120821 RepID=A0AAU7DVA1_9MICO